MNCQIIIRDSLAYRDAKALLESYALDTSDLDDGEVRLWSLTDQGQLIGVVGMERSMGIGLLRSLAVARSHQGMGLAKELCRAVFAQAKSEGIQQLYLLTESASAFFAGQGFSTIARNQAPDGLRATKQFSSLCPDSATVMARIA